MPKGRPGRPACSVTGCDKPNHAKGLCHPHYIRVLRADRPRQNTKGLTVEERLAFYSDRSGGPDACWPWTGHRNPAGYGQTYANGRRIPAHRLAAGATPSDEVVMHLCDNPPCVNPAHLRIGTQAENLADRDAKGRQRFNSLRGEAHRSSKLTEAKVRDIRARAAAGEMLKDLASEFEVSHPIVSRIVAGKIWTHI